MRCLVAVVCIMTFACGSARWEAIEPRQLNDGGEAMVVTETHAVHLRSVRVARGSIEGKVVAAWKVSVDASILDDKGRKPAAMAAANKWPRVEGGPNKFQYAEVLAVRVPVEDHDATPTNGTQSITDNLSAFGFVLAAGLAVVFLISYIKFCDANQHVCQ